MRPAVTELPQWKQFYHDLRRRFATSSTEMIEEEMMTANGTNPPVRTAKVG